MTPYTEEHFNTVKKRYLHYIIHLYQQAKQKARGKEFSKEIFLSFYTFQHESHQDPTTQKVRQLFTLYYELGHKIETIVAWILESLQTEYEQLIKRPHQRGIIKQKYYLFKNYFLKIL